MESEEGHVRKRAMAVGWLGLVLVALACDSVETSAPEPDLSLVTVTAKPVTALPAIDGDGSDAAWSSATALKLGVLTMKAVYTSDELAMLLAWDDRDLSINSRGTWSLNPSTGVWTQTGMDGSWQSYTGSRHPEWANISFDISSKMKTQGCYAFCHETVKDNGVWHHNTEVKGEYVDSWLLLTKHGFGPKYLQDMGWLAGVESVTQSGTLVFDPNDPIDSHQLLSGKLTFVGYAEDKFMTSPDDAAWPQTTRPADQYCIKCHTDQKAIDWTKTANKTYGDDGTLPYSANWNATYSAPVYMEKAPTSFADAMVLTQAEVDAGEAVAVAGLSSAQVAQYWASYAALNALVPQLVLKPPTGSQADVRVAATWNNGRWTLELKRKLVTGFTDDVQFADKGKLYYFGLSLWNHSDLVSPLARFQPGVMKFGS